MGKKIGYSYYRVAAVDHSASGVEKEKEIQRKIENYASEQGILVMKQYSDKGYSGLNMNRPGIKRLLNDLCDQGEKIDYLLVDSETNLSRNIMELIILLKEVNSYVETVMSVGYGKEVGFNMLDFNIRN